jgi:hypothetical protein
MLGCVAMTNPTPLTKADVAAVASPERVRILQIIYVALGAGVVSLGVVLWGISTDSEGFSSTALLSAVHGMLALGAFFMGMLLFELQIRRLGGLPSVDQQIATITAAYVIRAALFEGPALFGIIVLFLAGNQQLAAQPIYWTNLASTVIFLFMLTMTFPTPDRIRDLVRRTAHSRP